MAYLNPVLSLPAAQRLGDLPVEAREVLSAVLRDIGAEADVQAEESWRRRKAPMAAYWRAVGVYARHIARAADRPPTGCLGSHLGASWCPVHGDIDPEESGRALYTPEARAL